MIRDTDLDWRTISEHQPYFGVLANEQYLSQNLTPERVSEFYRSGVADIEHVVSTLGRISGRKFKPQRALDFGCGVGRLTLAIAKHARHVTGVDVADPMLELARRRASETKVRNADFVSQMPDGPVDWVNSLIVLQHIPPSRGHQIFDQLVDMLAPGGYLSVQLTFFRNGEQAAQLAQRAGHHRFDGERVELLDGIGNDEPGQMLMFDYDLNRIFRTLFTRGFDNVWTEHTDHGGFHGIYLFGVKQG